MNAYFLKAGVVKAVTGGGLTVITKALQDGNPHKGPQHKSPGRRKTHAGKVAWQAID